MQTLDAVVDYLVNKGIATRVNWGPSQLAGFKDLDLNFDPAASAESARIRLQQPAMNHCLWKAGMLAEWALFIDVDEYLFPFGRVPSAGSSDSNEAEQHPLPSIPDILSTPLTSKLKIQVSNCRAMEGFVFKVCGQSVHCEFLMGFWVACWFAGVFETNGLRSVFVHGSPIPFR